MRRIIKGLLFVSLLLSGFDGRFVCSLIVDMSLSEILPPLSSSAEKHLRRLYIIRHGETEWNRLGKMQGGGFDLELNENGAFQARAVAEALRDVPLGVLASSHLLRAKQTADHIFQQQRQPHLPHRMVLSGFGEMRFGEFEGLALRGPECTKEINQKYQEYNDQMKQDKSIPWPDGGESLQDVEQRAVQALRQILHFTTAAAASDESASMQHLGIVAHGRTINILLASLLDQDCRSFTHYHQRNCCVNVLDYDMESDVFTSRLLNHVVVGPEHVDTLPPSSIAAKDASSK
jgi:broad specificity phosphatase PhoE